MPRGRSKNSRLRLTSRPMIAGMTREIIDRMQGKGATTSSEALTMWQREQGRKGQPSR